MILRSATGLVLFLVVVVMLSLPAAAKSRDPIRFVRGETMEQQIFVQIAGMTLEKSEFKVTYVDIDLTNRTEAMASGVAHVFLEFPVTDAKDALAAARKKRRVRVLGGRLRNGRNEATLKVVWEGMQAKWPYAIKVIKTMTFPNDELRALAARASAEGLSPEAVAADWMAANVPIWKRWRTASKNWMTP